MTINNDGDCGCAFCEYHAGLRQRAQADVVVSTQVSARRDRLESDPSWVAANADVEALQAELDGLMQAAEQEWRTYQARVRSFNAAGESATALVEPDQYADAGRRGELQERLHRAMERRQQVEARIAA